MIESVGGPGSSKSASAPAPFALCVFLIVALAAATSSAQSLSGTVRTAVGALPLAGIDIDVFDASGAAVNIGPTRTDALGRYTAPLPGAGSYRLRADPTVVQGYAAMYYGGVGGEVALKSTAQVIAVGPADAVAGIDVALPTGVSLSGTVTAGGIPVAGVDIDVFAANGEFLSAYPGASGLDGTYSVGALPPGTYFVRADPSPALGQYWVRTFYGGAMSLLGATPIVVDAVPLTAADIDVPAGGTLAGVVTSAAGGTPLAGLDLDIFDEFGTSMDVTARTDPAGAYEIGAVPPGLYTLRVDPTSAQGWARTYHPAAGSPAAAIPIAAQAGGPTIGIDFALDAGGSLSGTIRAAADGAPLAGIDLDVFDANRRITRFTATSDAAGSFQIAAMKAGVYFVRADPSALQGFARQYYAEAIDIRFATPIAVAGGADSSGVEFALVPGGSISGTLWSPQMQPAAGVDLDLYDALSGARLRESATSGPDGGYRFDSLHPGAYKLRADATLAQGWALLYFDAKPSEATADPVNVEGAVTTSPIDFHLSPGGSISGLVSSASDGTPLLGIRLDVLRAATLLPLDQGAVTAPDGSYTLIGLDPGDYLVTAVPGPGTPFAPTYYGDTPGPSGAGVVSVAAGAQTPAIDIALPEPEPAVLAGSALLVLAALARRTSAVRGRRRDRT